jgi:hypothetical protein
VDHAWLSPPWTDRGRAARAHRSFTSGCSVAQGRRPRGRGREDGVGQLEGLLTGGQEALRWTGNGEQRWRPNVCGGGTLRCERGGQEGGVGCGEVRHCRVPYYMVGREAEAVWKGGAAGVGVRPV